MDDDDVITYDDLIEDQDAAIAEMLGASPAELDRNPEANRPHSMINHACCPEMDLSNVYDV